MKERTIEKEFKFLDSYFSRNRNVIATVITFNIEILEKETTNINNGDWLSIKEKLRSITYDGGTSYNNLSKHHNRGDILIFTDGHQNINISNPKFEGLLYIINTNTNSNFNNKNLKRLTLTNKGRLLNLAVTPRERSSIKQDLLFTGRVFYGNKIANDISVSIKNSDQKVQVDSYGSYAISAIADGSMNPNLDFTGLQKIANNEIKSLVTLRKDVLNTS
ncbi:MAG: hypothetical protein ACI9AT_000675 [Ulvibacter sp.]|jgi:hypothetical protein